MTCLEVGENLPPAWNSALFPQLNFWYVERRDSVSGHWVWAFPGMPWKLQNFSNCIRQDSRRGQSRWEEATLVLKLTKRFESPMETSLYNA